VAINHDRLLCREYVHAVLARLTLRPPAWFAEGLAQLYSRLDIAPDHYGFAKFDDVLIGYFQQRQMLPFDRLFAIGYDSPEFRQPVNGTFPAESLAFLHFCLYSRGSKFQQPLFAFVARLNGEPPSEKLFKEIFHRSYGEMGTALRSYIETGSYSGADYPLPHPLDVPAIALRDATDAEAGRIKGDTLRLAGRFDDARLELLSPHQRGHSDPRLLASLGLLAHAEQRDKIAEHYLGLAAADRVRLPGAYATLAQLRYAALTTPAAPPLTPPQTGGILDLLQTARLLPPPRADVYRLMAETWLHSATAPAPDALRALDEGVRRFPGDANLVHAAARAKLRAGLTADAASLAALGIRFAHDDATRARFRQLQDSLQKK